MSRNVIIKNNNSILYIIIIILIAFILFLLFKTKTKTKTKTEIETATEMNLMYFMKPPTSNMDNILKYKDPFQPPLQDIHINSRFQNNEYSQMGILTREEADKHPIILPLMGRMINRGDKIQYYTISNSGSNNTKLPIKKNGKYCTSERGCSELYSNDEVYVEGYKNSFRVTIYENKTLEYL